MALLHTTAVLCLFDSNHLTSHLEHLACLLPRFGVGVGVGVASFLFRTAFCRDGAQGQGSKGGKVGWGSVGVSI